MSILFGDLDSRKEDEFEFEVVFFGGVKVGGGWVKCFGCIREHSHYKAV